MKLFMTVSALTLAMFDVGSAQNFNACAAVLGDGVMTRADLRKSDESKYVFASRLAQMEYHEARRITDAGAEGSYEGMPLKGKYSKSDFDKWKSELKTSIDVSNYDKHQTSILLSSGDKNILAAWSGCINTVAGGDVETVYLQRFDNRADRLVLYQRYDPPRSDLTKYARLRADTVFDNAKIVAAEPKYYKKDEVIEPGKDHNLLLAPIDPSKPVTVIVDMSTLGTRVAYLAPPPIPAPVTRSFRSDYAVCNYSSDDCNPVTGTKIFVFPTLKVAVPGQPAPPVEAQTLGSCNPWRITLPAGGKEWIVGTVDAKVNNTEFVISETSLYSNNPNYLRICGYSARYENTPRIEAIVTVTAEYK